MERLTVCVVIVASIANFAEALVKCHDCTSWNPHCQETVVKPFQSAVAIVDCEVTSTCFLKQDPNGVIHRGCADGWLGSSVDVTLTGCRRQHLPWLGDMLWCFCKEDFCNGKSIATLSESSSPQPKSQSLSDLFQGLQLIDNGGLTVEEEEEEKEVEETEVNEVKEDQRKERETKKPPQQKAERTGHKHRSTVKNDDGIPGRTIPETVRRRKGSDGKYELWYWHANSDRPLRVKAGGDGEDTWRAPDWVETSDGKGWDFPVMGPVHEHTASETEDPSQGNDIHTHREDDTASAPASSSPRGRAFTPHTWSWGEGWGHIRPWWLGIQDQQDAEQASQPVYPDSGQSDGSLLSADKTNSDPGDVVISYDDNTEDGYLDVKPSDFFCWDCYSKSPLCRESVDTQMANHLGKIPCPLTRTCFLRTDGHVIYRGCADGWLNSRVDMDYVGCRVQPVWGQEVEWCFCTASLCNGDSSTHLQQKYSAHIQPFRAYLRAAAAGMLTNQTASTDTNHPIALPESMASGADARPTIHLLRKTPHGSAANLTAHFPPWNASTSISHQDSISAQDGRKSTNWRAVMETGNDEVNGNDVGIRRNETETMSAEGEVRRVNYEARGG